MLLYLIEWSWYSILDNTAIGDEGAIDFAQLIIKNSTLTELGLGRMYYQ